MVVLSATGQDREDHRLVLLAEIEDRCSGRGRKSPCGLIPTAIEHPVPVDAEHDLVARDVCLISATNTLWGGPLND